MFACLFLSLDANWARPFVGLLLVGVLASEAAADQRYSMQICKRGGPCAFVLDTETGEVRFCEPDGCRVLDAGAPVERPSPFPIPGQTPVPNQGAQPFPLGEMGSPDSGMIEQMNPPPSGAPAGAPSPFPFIEPAPAEQ